MWNPPNNRDYADLSRNTKRPPASALYPACVRRLRSLGYSNLSKVGPGSRWAGWYTFKADNAGWSGLVGIRWADGEWQTRRSK